MVTGKKLKSGRFSSVCYHGSWTHQSEKVDSRQSSHNASEVGYNQAILHTPVLPAHTAAELVEINERQMQNGERDEQCV